MTGIQRVPLDLINFSPFNVRQEIDVGSLTGSIERMGQIEPLRVRSVGDRFEIRTGMRRFLALKQAGATHADAIVVEGSDEAVIGEQWDENEERANYSDYERALKLLQMLDALGLNQTELAERIGKTQGWVAQRLRILKLDGIITTVIIRELNESQARAILQAPEDDWPALVQYVELHSEELGKIPPASAIEEYALDLARATEIGKNRRRFLEEDADFLPYKAGAEESPGTAEEPAEEVKAYIEEHDLGWVFDAEANGAGFLTKIAMLTDEELEFCLAHETRPLSLRRLNEETDRRNPRPLLKEPPASPATDPEVIASINTMVGEPVEDLLAKLVEKHGLTKEEADAALQAYRENYPDIWSVCYPEEREGEAKEPMTAEQYVADVLTHNPEVEPAELAKVTAEMFGVSEAYAQGLIDRNQSQKRGPKPRDPYAARSPVTTCPLCGRANAEMNRILMVLEEYQASKPGITLVDWLREVLA